ncbi:hypothetical protein GGS23DRAFT_542619 [Durotheca rogersii]|uniref:uncharacterized protein n=1 Tax=Durotheca rogersii TaxID=419775 RepID=UPI00221F603E|nr:uncharacterized protein GGS23DRAFT_542619 [Durotheca rogersii]KAI5852041.1 hypothetical protein GGS23DRAFT_542619 [Durotheca rogersii]
MQFKTLALTLFLAAAAAESVQELVAQIPACAKTCLDNASTEVGCAVSDNKCQCGKANDLTQASLICVSTSCTSDELSDTTELSARICAAVALEAGGDAIKSAGSAATSALGDAGSAATSVLGNAGAAATSLIGDAAGHVSSLIADATGGSPATPTPASPAAANPAPADPATPTPGAGNRFVAGLGFAAAMAALAL